MIFRLLDAIIHMIFYGLGLAGVIYLFRAVWKDVFVIVQRGILGLASRRQVKTFVEAAQARAKIYVPERKGFYFHLSDLLAATLPVQRTDDLPKRFIYFSLIFAGVIYLLVYVTENAVLFPFIIAMPSVVLPYLILLLWRQRVKIKNSYDIVPVITLLNGEYTVHEKDMLLALSATIDKLPRSNIRRALYRLHLRLQRYISERDALDAFVSFQKQTGTDWTIRLSQIVSVGIIDNIDVSVSLSRLVHDVTDIEKTIKTNRWNRVDSMWVGMIGLPGLFAGLVYFQFVVTNKTFYLQFHTSSGLFRFYLSFILALFSFVVSLVFYRPKQEM